MKRRDLIIWTLRCAAALTAVFVVFFLDVDQANHIANITATLVQGAAIYLFFFDQDLLARILLRVRRLMRSIIGRSRAPREPQAKTTQPASEQTPAPAPALQGAPPSLQPSPPPPPAPSAPTSMAPELARSEFTSATIAETPDAENAPSNVPKALRRRTPLAVGALGLFLFGVVAWVAIQNGLHADQTQSGAKIGNSAPPPPLPPPPSTSETSRPLTTSQEAWNYATRDGDSCWAVAERAANNDPALTTRFWLAIIELNRAQCPTNRDEVVIPGTIFRMPAEISQSSLATPTAGHRD